MFFSTLISVVVLAAQAIALPSAEKFKQLEVFRPTITYPTAGVIWPKGSTQNVTWDTSNIPPEVQNNAGQVLLGHEGNDSENLDTAHPLAVNIPIMDGTVAVTVPDTADARDDYFVVLFGDSANASPDFTIS